MLQMTRAAAFWTRYCCCYFCFVFFCFFFFPYIYSLDYGSADAFPRSLSIVKIDMNFKTYAFMQDSEQNTLMPLTKWCKFISLSVSQLGQLAQITQLSHLA